MRLCTIQGKDNMLAKIVEKAAGVALATILLAALAAALAILSASKLHR